MNDHVEIWKMVRQVEHELADARARRRARIGPLPQRSPSVGERPAWFRRMLARWLCPGRDGAPIEPATGQEDVEMKWVTRERPKVDRIACPWLIRRFVDPEAEFLYVPPDQVLAVAERESAIPYDVPGVELGHQGAECSFDAIVRKYNLTDPALDALAQIVRGADTDAQDLAPESRGLVAIAEGFRLVYEDDHQQLDRELPVYDALYAYCRRRLEQA